MFNLNLKPIAARLWSPVLLLLGTITASEFAASIADRTVSLISAISASPLGRAIQWFARALRRLARRSRRALRRWRRQPRRSLRRALKALTSR